MKSSRANLYKQQGEFFMALSFPAFQDQHSPIAFCANNRKIEMLLLTLITYNRKRLSFY